MKKFVFWGAGKIGKQAYYAWSQFGYVPDFFVDRNAGDGRTEFEHVRIISPEELFQMGEELHIFITCKNDSQIWEQLERQSYDLSKVECLNTWGLIISRLFEQNYLKCGTIKTGGKVLFDLSNGLAIGGVESWSVDTASLLSGLSVPSKFLVNSDRKREFEIDENQLLFYPEKDDSLRKAQQLIEQNLPCAIVCNFAGIGAAAAALEKIKHPNEINLIAVQHSDDPAYYDMFSKLTPIIGHYLYISSAMRKKMRETGADFLHSAFLPWSLKGEALPINKHTSDKIRLGYVGRLTTVAKRCDLLPMLALELRNRGLDFEMSIVGDGDYFNTLKADIEENDLGDCVKLLGTKPHSEILSFWRAEDIAVSVSEWEGHSISQCEAMLAGAVPVLTDVSGVRDDVEDGLNGFVVEVGNIEQMADRIVRLATDRNLLKAMSQKANQTIAEKYTEKNVLALWKEIL